MNCAVSVLTTYATHSDQFLPFLTDPNTGDPLTEGNALGLLSAVLLSFYSRTVSAIL